MMRKMLIPVCFVGLGLPRAVAAVDLVTLPSRAYLQLTVYNSEDLTLVRERRVLTFKTGLNRIQFDWHGTLIDPTSVNLMPLEHQDKVVVLDTSFPPNRPDVCQWSIASGIEGPVLVEIWYFTSGITWQADYVCLANADETEMTLRGYVRVANNSGEEYPDAQTRVVVGTINLVEKIAELALRGHPRPTAALALDYSLRRFEREAMQEVASREPKADGRFVFKQPKEVKKEGLSEYFIFTIEGTETVIDGWSKQLRAIAVEKVPLTLLYKLSDKETGGQLRKFYKFYNKKIEKKEGQGQLGECPLPDGGVRAFRVADSGDLAYVGAANTKYIPISEKVELDLGVDPDVTARRLLKDYRRTHIVLDEDGRVKSYREQFHYAMEIDNTRPRDIQVEIERQFGGDFDLHDLTGAERFEKVDQRTAKYYVDLRAREKRTITYRVEVFHPDRK